MDVKYLLDKLVAFLINFAVGGYLLAAFQDKAGAAYLATASLLLGIALALLHGVKK